MINVNFRGTHGFGVGVGWEPQSQNMKNAVTHIDFSIVQPRGLNQMAYSLNISISPTIK